LKRQKISKWLASASSSAKQQALRAKRVRNTGKWFLEDPRLKKWISGDALRLLLCPGIGISARFGAELTAGSGKSVLMFYPVIFMLTL